MASAEEQEIADKVGALCIARYGEKNDANMRALFMGYDASGNGTLNRSELRELLADAGVGNGLTRGYWVDGVFDALDKDPLDGELTWEEYKRVPKAQPAPPPVLDKYDGPMTPYGQLPSGCDAKTGLCIAPATGSAPGTTAASRSAQSLQRPMMVGAAGALGWLFLGPFGGIAGAAAASFFAPK
jgi:hypothetical protein